MKKVVIIISLVIVLILIYLIATAQTYEKYNIIILGTDTSPPCEVYYEKCTCYGFLTSLESSPPKYSCSGIPICKSIARDEPVSCSQE